VSSSLTISPGHRGGDPHPVVGLHAQARRAQHPGDGDDRGLHQRRAAQVGVQLAVAEDRADDGLQLVPRLDVGVLQVDPRGLVQRLVDEERPQLAHQELGVAVVVHDEAQDVVRAEAPLVPEDPLDAAVVVLRLEPHGRQHAAGLLALDEPRQRAGGLADVGLGVAVALAEREELHQLAREVLVGLVLIGPDQVEERAHRRVLHDVAQQRGERPQRAAAEERVLAQQHRRVDVARGEVVVPEEHHLLFQRPRGADHPVQPPQHVVAVLVDRVELHRLGPGQQRRLAPVRGQQPVDRVATTAMRPLAGLVLGGAEPGAPQRTTHVCLVPPRHRTCHGSSLQNAVWVSPGSAGRFAQLRTPIRELAQACAGCRRSSAGRARR
jgi:hypothetical protein